ncbi:Serine/threonine-protein kinase GRIK1 [Vitis vinifera]|uniref:Serine/threonine-protein kinase GRIK1 n=1 Tax=Vitis vinifera TaxID=29760 RepID=A0A438DTI2_VITVI|nr:Serine/threonine-protein kinase GRIK1 [Vitis vinifera]
MGTSFAISYNLLIPGFTGQLESVECNSCATLLKWFLMQDDNDELRRSPGTPVFTAPECCLGLTYHGKAADTWAVGVTLYCMVLGQYPFLGESLQDTYDKIVNNLLSLPDNINPQLRNLLEGLLCKDPNERMTLDAVAKHAWVIGEEGPIPQYLCWCRRNILLREDPVGNGKSTLT